MTHTTCIGMRSTATQEQCGKSLATSKILMRVSALSNVRLQVGARTNNRFHNPSQDKLRVVLQEVAPQVLVPSGVDIDP